MTLHAVVLDSIIDRIAADIAAMPALLDVTRSVFLDDLADKYGISKWVAAQAIQRAKGML